MKIQILRVVVYNTLSQIHFHKNIINTLFLKILINNTKDRVDCE